ncbi:FecR domain-containing protein [Nodosilinea sp. P-1105]|uniref:FecR domain-containing protein n=1 Tax=Nodosilinea sp. P-1105 TaxID=2546229 RepID=UPI00197E224D|nr:FecR domain-containing protein [Nodosilinea sp. P-1105]
MAVALAGLVIGVPSAQAEVPFTRAWVNFSTNQVHLASVAGNVRPAVVAECLCPGDRITTNVAAKAELLFNDGSLVRMGEQSSLHFWPQTRQLRLRQGTTALFVPPDQGRTAIHTANAIVGLQNAAVVVRYVPERNLTLVMALTSDSAGPISLSTNDHSQTIALLGGQMALVSGTDIEVAEFDLQGFYQTSRLVLGLNIPDSRPLADQPHDPIATLRPHLRRALAQQSPFDGPSAIVDPNLIGRPNRSLGTTSPEPVGLEVSAPLPSEENWLPATVTPPGVVTPLPESEPAGAPAVGTSGDMTVPGGGSVEPEAGVL